MKKKRLKALGVSLLLYSGLSAQTDAPFKIDGNFSEWEAVPVAYANTEYKYVPAEGWQNAHTLKTQVTDTHVYFYIEGNMNFTLTSDEVFYVFFDTDKNPNTGYQHGGGAYPKVGAELAFEGSLKNPGVRTFNAAGEWGELRTEKSRTDLFRFSEVKEIEGGKNGIEFAVDRSLFGTAQEQVSFVFSPDFLTFRSLPEAYRNREPVKIDLASKQ